MVKAWYDPTNHVVSADKHDSRFTSLGQLLPLVPKHEWVGLTDEDIYKLIKGAVLYKRNQIESFAKRIEAKLKEKNT